MTAPVVDAFGPFIDSGVLTRGDVLLAARLGRIVGEDERPALLATALCLAELQRGAVCLVLDAPPPLPDGLAWPTASAWRDVLRRSPLVGAAGSPADRPLRLDGDRLYLQRYWQDEEMVRQVMAGRTSALPPPDAAIEAALDAMFTDPAQQPSPEQRQAARVAARSRVTLLAGGPGTGKTWTVAHVLGVLAEIRGGDLRVAVAAPTGKAATRLQEAIANERPSAAPAWIGELRPSTLHRLLRRRPGPHEVFRYNRDNPLPHDVVIVDEMSMVSLPLMARLLEAVGNETQLILVGDPDQLASVEAGAVFGDLVRLAAGQAELVRLRENHRFTGQLQTLAEAIRAGDAAAAVAALDAGGNVTFIESHDGSAAFSAVRADAIEQAQRLQASATAGDADGALGAMERFRVLCAHREGHHGVARWSRLIDEWGAQATGRRRDGNDWYLGRPLMVTRNDYDAGVFNGETGVVIHAGDRDVAVIDQGGTRPLFAPTQLQDVETLHAMTVHKAQGSQYHHVTVVLPPPDSPLLTRELLYTAVTRARQSVRIVGTHEAVRVAVGRSVRRASGLSARREA